MEEKLELSLPQNEAFLGKPVQFEYLEPSISLAATESQAQYDGDTEEDLEPSIRANILVSKKSRFQTFIGKTAADIEYTESFNRCEIEHLKLLHRNNKK